MAPGPAQISHKLPLATKNIASRAAGVPKDRPVAPKTNRATYGRSSLFAVITTTKYNNFALLISFHLVLQAHYA